VNPIPGPTIPKTRKFVLSVSSLSTHLLGIKTTTGWPEINKSTNINKSNNQLTCSTTNKIG
jgi:hypothetical protein